MTPKITESEIETFAIELLESSGYQYIYGPDIAPDSDRPERASFEDVLLLEPLQTALRRINPSLPADAIEDAVKQIQRIHSPELIANNETFHRMLTEGVKVSYQKDGKERGDLVWLVDFNNPDNNDFVVCNQFTVIENNPSTSFRTGVNKRPDVILFINGLPLVVIELKNPADENATVKSAFKQIQTYKNAIPSLFTYNGFCVISDGLEARAGTISSGYSRFMAWKTADGKIEASPLIGQLETLIKGMLNKKTLLDLIRHFIVFERSVQTQPSLSPSQGEGRNAGVGSRGEGSHYRGGMQFTGMIKQVRELRKNQTKAEKVFWELVRNKRFFGQKFGRQHQIGHYIVDFYCHSEKLIIELDGEVHNTLEQKKKDEKRDKYLKSLGFRILRFKNSELFENTENVFKTIAKSLSFYRNKKGSSPSGRGGGEGGITSVTTIKKLAAYHQYYAVNRAVESTLRAAGFEPTPEPARAGSLVRESPESYGVPGVKLQPVGDRKGGVVWHTQGSGKSLSMVFYTGKIVLEMLENSIRKYHKKIITAAEFIEELIKLGKDIQEMDKKPQEMDLSTFEYAFYTAIANNKSARELMQKAKLRELAIVLYERVKQNASIDWTIKESVKAKLKVIVKRTLRQYGYPPDMQKLATETVLKQAELIANELTKGE